MKYNKPSIIIARIILIISIIVLPYFMGKSIVGDGIENELGIFHFTFDWALGIFTLTISALTIFFVGKIISFIIIKDDNENNEGNGGYDEK